MTTPDDTDVSGTRRRHHTDQRRDRRVSVRLTDDELARLQERAQGAGMAVATYLAQTALTHDHTADLILDDLTIEQRLLRELLTISRQLRQDPTTFDSGLYERHEEVLLAVAAWIRRHQK